MDKISILEEKFQKTKSNKIRKKIRQLKEILKITSLCIILFYFKIDL